MPGFAPDTAPQGSTPMGGPPQPQRPDNWSEMTREQKLEWRFEQWRNTSESISFVNAEAKASYKKRVERSISVLKVEEPDQVPVSVMPGMLPYVEAGISYHTALYDPERALEATRAFNEKHAEDLGSWTSPMMITMPARALDILDTKLYSYPGHGMSADSVGTLQYIEGEYMLADEYDALMRDPSDYWLRTFLPRAYGSFEVFGGLDSLTTITEIGAMQLPALGRPDVQATLQRLLDAGKEISKFQQIIMAEAGQAEAHGYPMIPRVGMAKAPFDILGDTLRGTRAILTDMRRQPYKLLAALDVITDITIDSVLNSPLAMTGIAVSFPLHKGADGWMSEEQFLKFYWPSLRRLMNAIIDEGMIVSHFAEGMYSSRLELVNEFPKGSVSWWFDKTDMAKAKRLLGSDCSIEGNLPLSLLQTATPEEVKEACRKLIETCAPGGGYVLGVGAIPEYPKLENVQAMVDAGREYGVY
jgi:uroporphyrinogen-III decarboxylase